MTNTEVLTHDIDIQEVVGDMIAPSTSVRHAEELFEQIVDTIDRSDLQAGKIVQTEYERDRLLLPLAEKPFQVVNSEIRLLGSLSSERLLQRQNGLQRVTEFVTRSATEIDIDARYRAVTDSQTGANFTAAETLLQGQLETPCYISTANGKLSIAEKTWRRGEWQYIERSIEAGQRGEKLLRAFVGSTIWAAHLAMTRGADERQAADVHAKQLLVADRIKARGPLVLF